MTVTLSEVLSKTAPPALTPGDVGAIFGVHPRTAARWAQGKRFGPDGSFRTPGGHWRFDTIVIRQHINQSPDA